MSECQFPHKGDIIVVVKPEHFPKSQPYGSEVTALTNAIGMSFFSLDHWGNLIIKEGYEDCGYTLNFRICMKQDEELTHVLMGLDSDREHHFRFHPANSQEALLTS